jgi:hypothetical protein
MQEVNSVETGTDISLNYYKELKLNYNEKYNRIVDELKNKYTSSTFINNKTLKQSGNTFNEYNGYIGKSHTIEHLRKKKLINIKEIKMKNCRFDKFNRMKAARDRVSVSSGSQKRSPLIKDNNIKYKKIVKDVNSLINNLEMNLSKDTFHKVTVRDSFLNSYKNFIVINKYDKFREGIPVLQLKKDDFFNKAKYYKSVSTLFNIYLFYPISYLPNYILFFRFLYFIISPYI